MRRRGEPQARGGATPSWLGAWWSTLAYAALAMVATSLPQLPRPAAAWLSLPGRDKIGHFALYAVMGLLIWRSARLRNPRARTWRLLATALASAAVYAALDESRQLLIRGRSGDWRDWLADLAGLTVVMALAAVRERLTAHHEARTANKGDDREQQTTLEDTAMAGVCEVTSANFDAEVAKSDLPVLVDFWAPWCGPCRMVGPIVEALAVKYAGKLKVCKSNVDQAPDLAGRYGIRSIPSLLIFKGGEKIAQQVGASGEAELSRWVDGAIGG